MSLQSQKAVAVVDEAEILSLSYWFLRNYIAMSIKIFVKILQGTGSLFSVTLREDKSTAVPNDQVVRK